MTHVDCGLVVMDVAVKAPADIKSEPNYCPNASEHDLDDLPSFSYSNFATKVLQI